MRFVIAPDSFKGSLSSVEASAAIKNGVLRVFPDAEIVAIPLADGGEGTLDALLAATDGIRKIARVRGPLDEEIEANWGILPNGSAVIEIAQACGLNLTPPEKRDAWRASSFGVGQLILAALNAGCRRFLIGLGGSATTDGASGALSALGARFFDQNGVVLPLGGGFLGNLAQIDLKYLDSRLEKCEFTLLCDVQSPLCGENGAAHIYGSQKGASTQQIERLDAALSHFADLSAQKLSFDCQNENGAGAAGGLGFGLMAFLGAQPQSGIEAVLQATQFEEKLAGADLVLTGEGTLDAQTLSGKAVAGVCRAAKLQNVPVLAFGGTIALSGAQMDELGLLSAFCLADGPRELDFCLQNGAQLLENAVERALRIWK